MIVQTGQEKKSAQGSKEGLQKRSREKQGNGEEVDDASVYDMCQHILRYSGGGSLSSEIAELESL